LLKTAAALMIFGFTGKEVQNETSEEKPETNPDIQLPTSLAGNGIHAGT